MKVLIDDKVHNYHSIWMEDEIIFAIDQRKLPFTFEIFETKTLKDTCFTIKEMVVRGAPLIGVTTAYGLLQVSMTSKEVDIRKFISVIKNAMNKLSKTRPTAIDLFNTINRIEQILDEKETVQRNQQKIKIEVEKIAEETLQEAKQIGEVGNAVIPENGVVMTICNAGALATIDYGTALAPIRKAHESKKNITVYVNETRPRMQGARLTAWELYNESIEHYIIADSAAGYYLSQKKIDVVIVGADRVTFNGDVANKIGTYTLSVLCKENNVPFYIALPHSTFDLNLEFGKDIIIEQRDGLEVQTAMSIDTVDDIEVKRRIIHFPKSKNLNPAFDITPAQNVTGYITPSGIVKPSEIRKFLKK
ncbi:MAG: S-methyl-5-thioribose-1-phosphate isomerase [Candidatus Heimdallarchaeota archaeon]